MGRIIPGLGYTDTGNSIVPGLGYTDNGPPPTAVDDSYIATSSTLIVDANSGILANDKWDSVGYPVTHESEIVTHNGETVRHG